MRGIFAALALTVATGAAHGVQDTLEQRLVACAACHGEHGEGLTKAEFYPRLAGKPAGYLYNQLVAFRDGRRRNPAMNYLVAHLSDAYLREIAEHYERLAPPYPPPTPAPKALAARGQALATKGDPSRELPACISCHGDPPYGMQPGVPGLAGLSRHYIASQMGAWRIGQRRSYEPDCMRTVAEKLTAEDAAAIAAWLGSLPASAAAKPLAAGALKTPLDCGGAPREERNPPPATGPAKRGEYLARAGNCFACHTARGGEPYAGGVPIPTPFGTVFSTNITPDRATGIGGWSADDFWRALHDGKSKDRGYLYPAFPFPSYTKVSREDSDALYAYLRTLKPVRRENRADELRFPYNRRWLMAVWRLLYFRSGVYRDDRAQSAEWNRGAYLVQGLGHCNACHASRNVLGATVANDFSGGLLPAQNWYAPSLASARETGLGGWPVEDLAAFLATGVSPRAAASGPMAPVVRHGLQHLSREDARAMAVYLKSQVRPAPAPAAPPRRIPAAEVERMTKHGARVYERHCESCHGRDGEGTPGAYPALAGNASLLVDPPVNALRMVYAGGFPPSTAGNPRPYGMPPFYQDLSDDDVASVVTFIRRAWGNAGSPVSQLEAAQLRGVPAD